MIKNITTSVSTGDTFEKNGSTFVVGLMRKIDGKRKIELRKTISKTSCITILLSTRELNKLIEE